jgi:hypothetical protein
MYIVDTISSKQSDLQYILILNYGIKLMHYCGILKFSPTIFKPINHQSNDYRAKWKIGNRSQAQRMTQPQQHCWG